MRRNSIDIPQDILRKLYEEELLTQQEIANRFGCTLTLVQRRMKKYGIIPRTKAQAGIIRNHSFRCDFDGNLHEKAYLLGFCKGDIHPWVRGKKAETIRLMSATTKPEQIELFQKLFAPYGRIYIGKPDTRGATHMAAYVNMSMSFLLDREDNIPDWILVNPDIFFAFFAGYTDAEAHIGVHNGYAVYKLDTCDKNIIFQSYKRLSEGGISGPNPFIVAARGYANKHGYRYHGDLWRLQVGSKSSLLVLFEKIGPYLKHAKRIQDMEAAIQNVKARNTGIRPSVLKGIKR